MKPLKPGRYWSPDGIHIVRVAKRINGCKGCILDSVYTCPNIRARNSKKDKEHPDCLLNGIIFIKP